MTRKLFTTLVTVLAMVLLLGTVANAETTRPVILVDESYSSSYFSYEPFVTGYLDNVYAEVIKFGNGSKTMLYDQVQQAIDEGYTNIYIISDCWNTAGSAGVRQNNAGITLLTPYFESDKVDMHLYQVERKLNSSVPLKVYYWNEWPEMKKMARLEPETDPDEDPMYRSTKIDEDVMEHLDILADEKDVAKTANTINNEILDALENQHEVYVLGACSNSNSEFQKEVIEKVYVPSSNQVMITEVATESNEFLNSNGNFTGDVVSAINGALKKASPKANICLLSDLQYNSEVVLNKESSKNFEGTITIVYYPNDKLDMSKKFVQELQRQLPKATLKIC